jgi:DNA-binding CsgD family transcriptional regulator
MMDFLQHYGTPRHSGRYPWGSGNEPYQSSESVSARYEALRRKGLSEKEASQALGMSIAEVRAQKSLERAERRAADVAFAQKLKAKGMSTSAIAERMGRNESSVRSLLDVSIQERSQITKNTTDMLRSAVKKGDYIDVGVGVEAQLGISKTRLDTSLKALENEGYKVINVQVDQLGTDKKTTVKVLAPPGTTYRDVVTNKSKIKLPQEHSEDRGRTFRSIKPPVSVSSDRIQVVYSEDGGGDKDGLIELRRGAQDLSMGTHKYGQVRIAVDGTHYLKGMAIFDDNLPRGVDIRFNTSKTRTPNKKDAFKPISDDPENPFGSTIMQFDYTDRSGKKHQSPINIVGSEKSPNVEGRWEEWSRTLSSQVLSKQPVSLAERQLGLDLEQRQKEYQAISNLDNPVIKRHLLNSFSDDCDSAAVHLKAAALPRQMNHVLLPVRSMPDNQIYAPNYKNGEKVVLIRHPHGGTFEIPELTVNNNHSEARRIMGQSRDAVGINPNVAKLMSGADFDGDHVIVIPNPRGKNQIQISKPLKDLKDFDPITRYPGYEGMTPMTGRQKQRAMGEVSNLITDMTIKGANHSEIARAVRHSMVVIDAEKHKLNHKQSYIDNGIEQLRVKYQGKPSGGASTLISRSRAEARVPHRKEGQPIGPISPVTGKPTRLYVDPKTGKKLYEPTGETYVKDGKTIRRMSTVKKMELVDDANELASGTTMEKVYANYANTLKNMGNSARKQALGVKNIPYSPDAKKKYSKEVRSLNDKLVAATANRPLERKAQILANEIVAAKRKNNPHLSKDEVKKLKGHALIEARDRVGAKKPTIVITPKEWSAIQKGAVSNAFLEKIIQNADLDNVRSLATPRTSREIPASYSARARAMQANGKTIAQIAEALGVSTSTISSILD